MKASTLFSGIGAPEVAMPGWHWLWHAEIEKFPSAVMAVRYPHSVNLGDVTAHDFTSRALAIGRPDVLVFGSPCQSFSVAGRRLGLDDPRGNLALVALGIVAALKPTWFVFENVPGLLSSGERRDFGLFLRAVDELGYHLAWTVLDAQFAGVAQRRERLFAVGHARDWRYPAAVLFEPESLCGHPPTRQQARQDVTRAVAPSLTGSGRGVERPGESRGQDPIVITGTLTGCASAGGHGRFASSDAAAQNFLVAGTLKSNNGGGGFGSDPSETFVVAKTLEAGGHSRNPLHETLIAHSLRADGFNASEDGTGRGTPLVPVAFSAKDYGADAGELAPTLRSGGHDKSHANCGAMPAVAYALRSDASRHGEARTLSPDAEGRARLRDPGFNVMENLAPTVDAGASHSVFAFTENQRAEVTVNDTAGSLKVGGGKPGQGYPAVMASGVRRLTPRECERLQGLPDDYTLITYRGKPSKDGPRYKAIGNSMAVPVVRWILNRIEWLELNAERLIA